MNPLRIESARRIFARSLAAVALSVGVAATGPAPSSALRAAESDPALSDVRRWLEAACAEGPLPSFRQAGAPSRPGFGDWPVARTETERDGSRREIREEWKDPRSGLVVRSVRTEYHDAAAIEWVVHVRNDGDTNAPCLADLRALDAVLPPGASGTAVLHHHTGSPCTPRDYEPHATPLAPGRTLRFAPPGGRPSDSVLPYFLLEGDGRGVVLAVGWPGRWSAEFSRDAAGGTLVRAGQEQTRMVLRPGEEVRTPRIALLFYRGDRLDGQNRWRRWMLAHVLPRPGGRLPPAQLAACSSHQYGEMVHADEASQILFVDRYLAEGLRLDYWWMDAGWYVQRTGWPNVGTWEVDRRRFPRGLRAITDHARARGVRSIVWFEPERVTPGTWLYETRPEWLLSAGRSPARIDGWRRGGAHGPDPCVTHNPTSHAMAMASVRWAPGRLALHPGPAGEYGAIRWTAPRGEEVTVEAAFLAIDPQATTSVHLLHGGRPVASGWVGLHGQGARTVLRKTFRVEKGASVDLVVGRGDGSHVCDSTGLEARIRSGAGEEAVEHDAARGFSSDRNPAGPWSYGFLLPGSRPDGSTFRRLEASFTEDGSRRTRLLDLGNPEARRWLVDHIDGLIESEGIDLFRSDFNIDPLPYWRAADGEDREGMTENRYVTGYLAYWDELRRRHPRLLIDSCASGGRRNDLETLRRAVPLLRSDYIFEPVGQQLHTYGIRLSALRRRVFSGFPVRAEVAAAGRGSPTRQVILLGAAVSSSSSRNAQ